MVQDARQVPQITPDRADLRTGAQQGLRVHYYHRVVIDVDHPRRRPGRRAGILRHLMDTGGGRIPRADGDELPDARFPGKKPDGTAQELPARPGRGPGIWHHGEQGISELPVPRVVVLAAEQVIMDAGDIRHARPATGHQAALSRCWRCPPDPTALRTGPAFPGLPSPLVQITDPGRTAELPSATEHSSSAQLRAHRAPRRSGGPASRWQPGDRGPDRLHTDKTSIARPRRRWPPRASAARSRTTPPGRRQAEAAPPGRERVHHAQAPAAFG